MSWQMFVSFAKEIYGDIADSAYALVGNDIRLQILSIVAMAVVGGLFLNVVGSAADRLAEHNAATLTRVLYGIFRFAVLYPILIFAIMAEADGCMGGRPGAGIPIICGMVTAYVCARRSNRRNWTKTKSKG